jgi:hypothetical protein
VVNSWMREDLNRIEGTIARRKGSVLVVHWLPGMLQYTIFISYSKN